MNGTLPLLRHIVRVKRKRALNFCWASLGFIAYLESFQKIFFHNKSQASANGSELATFHGLEQLQSSVKAKMVELEWKSNNRKLFITHWIAPSLAAVGLLSAFFAVYRFSMPVDKLPQPKTITIYLGQFVYEYFVILTLSCFILFLGYLMWILGCDGISTLWQGNLKKRVLAIPRLFGTLRYKHLIVGVSFLLSALCFYIAYCIIRHFVL